MLNIDDINASYEILRSFKPQPAQQQWPILTEHSHYSGQLWGEGNQNIYNWGGHFDLSCVQQQERFQTIWKSEIECDKAAQWLFISRAGLLGTLCVAKAFHYIGDINVPIAGGNLGPFGWGVAIGLVGVHPDELGPYLGVASVIHLFGAGYRLQGMVGLMLSVGVTIIATMALESQNMQTRRAQLEERQRLSDETFAEVWKAMSEDLNERYTAFNETMDLEQVESLTQDAQTIWRQREAIRGTYGVLSGTESRQTFDHLCNLCSHILIRVGTINRLKRDELEGVRLQLEEANREFKEKFPYVSNTAWRERLSQHYEKCLTEARRQVATGGGQEELQRAKRAFFDLIEGAKKISKGSNNFAVQLYICTSHQEDPLSWFKKYDQAVESNSECYDVARQNPDDVRRAWCVATYLKNGEWGKRWNIKQKLQDFEHGIVSPAELFRWINEKIQNEYRPTLIDPPAPGCPVVAWCTQLYLDRGGEPSQ